MTNPLCLGVVTLGSVAAMIAAQPATAQPVTAQSATAQPAATQSAAAPIVHGPPATTAAILAAEAAWSAHVGAVGIAKGFSDWLDPVDGLAFTGVGDPARGPAIYGAFGGGAPSTLKLSWVPAEVFAARGGDMAASWGRFTIVDTGGKAKPVTGRYVTVWHKLADGTWKALIDIGNPES